MSDSVESGLFAVLKVGATISGLAGASSVRIISVDRLTDDSASVAYRTEAGALAEKIVFADMLVHLKAVEPGSAFAFDASPEAFLLAAEARRMRLAHLFDPLAALGTSNVEPLPHQLRAVYGEMLPRQPLRYVLADDPGAGKTVMAGLLIKELLLRGDAANVLVVSPGGLVDQWDEELREKFAIEVEMLTRDKILGEANPFNRGGLWLARLDMLARDSESVLDKACTVDWDLIIIDEAHKMSASVWGGEVKKTKRYQMAEQLGKHTRNLLLMTATPHSGKEEQFQLFMALLDSDRFEGVAREGTRKVDVSDMMRRLVKEELLTFDGTRLFPERFAYTVRYELTGPEKDLYRAVTEYVREEMNRNDASDGDKSRKVAVGFALTTLQRRLASSPAAIHRSLERRKKRLETELAESRLVALASKKDTDLYVPEDEEDLEELTDAEREAFEDKAIAAATASRTPEELIIEIEVLEQLLDRSLAVKTSPTYAKWNSLRDTLDDNLEMRDSTGARRKVIIFTEHKDTLDDLVIRLTEKTGDPNSVITIHGGTKREDRKKAKETFEQDAKCVFLVATDAAGEGINLHKNAHLLINYDLPWNPNRIEQRFGRVHRIGQPNVCHMWSLVAKETREGDVYTRLLEKLDEQRAALGGRVYDVLGKMFEGNSLRDLMIEAIREGDKPERQRYLTEVVDAKIGEGIAEILEENQLVPSHLDESEVNEVRKQMERAEAARLQPHHVEAFFHKAFKDLGGNLRMRESHRYEIRSVPSEVKEHDRITGYGAPIVNAYHRVTFDPKYVRAPGNNHLATLVHPGHPLMSATMGVVTDRHHDALRRGTILIDRADFAIDPYVVSLLEHDVTDERTGRDGQPFVVSRRAQYVRVNTDGTITALTQSPIPNLDAATDDEKQAAQKVLQAPWCQAADLDARVIKHASATVARNHATAVTASTQERVAKTERLVRDRLTKEINYWDQRAFELREQERAGKKTRLPAAQIEQRTEALARRLERRLKELEKERDISARPPRMTGACLVITQGWLDAQVNPEAAVHRAKETTRIERLAVDAVLRVERAHKHNTTEMPHNNPGYDIESETPAGLDFIEVKGRFEGGETFVLTRQEAVTALNKGQRSVLALVRVLSDDSTTVRYLRQPINQPIDPRAARVEFDWDPFWNEAKEMDQK